MNKYFENENLEMELIANAGDARSLAFEGLEKAKAGDYDGAFETMKKAEEANENIHRIQTELLTREANRMLHNTDEGSSEINLLMIHAQDHIMASMLAQELIKELVILYRDKESRKTNCQK